VNNDDLEFLRKLPNEIFASLGTITEAKVQRLREIQAMTKCFAEVVKEDRAKHDAEIRALKSEIHELKSQNIELHDELTALKSRMSQFESIAVRDLESQ
jgi:regulator of replication initiation timing